MPGLLYNDTDAENDPLIITAVGGAINGTVSPSGTAIAYTHDGSETSIGGFSYTVTDGTDTSSATVKISVTPVNDPPKAVSDRGTVKEGGTLYLEVPGLLYNDTDAENDPLIITAVGDAINGTVSLDGTAIAYIHDGSETTTGRFSYTVTDGADSDTTTVAITVVPVDEKPASADDTVTVATPPEPSESPADDGGTELWLVLLITLVAVVLAGGGAAVALRGRNRT